VPALRTEPPASDQQFIFVKDGTKLVKIDLDSILYIEGFGDYVKIITKTNAITSLKNLKNLAAELPAYFVRVHNSYIISVKAINSIQQNNVHVGDKPIPIGITYKKSFFEVINYKESDR
jgi:two-component system LytT family response regulator